MQSEVNIIINTFLSDYDRSLSEAIWLNVTNPLQLADFALKCPRIECFADISTCYSQSERKGGYIEEKMYADGTDWEGLYQNLLSQSKLELDTNTTRILGPFPNTTNFAKRMAEHVLGKRCRVPLLILRPTMIAGANSEPVPGYVESLGFANGIFILFGTGQLKDIAGNTTNLGDLIPIDFVVN